MVVEIGKLSLERSGSTHNSKFFTIIPCCNINSLNFFIDFILLIINVIRSIYHMNAGNCIQMFGKKESLIFSPHHPDLSTSAYTWYIPSCREIFGIQPICLILELSINFLGVPSGLEESKISLPLYSTTSLIMLASSNIFRSLPEPTLIVLRMGYTYSLRNNKH